MVNFISTGTMYIYFLMWHSILQWSPQDHDRKIYVFFGFVDFGETLPVYCFMSLNQKRHWSQFVSIYFVHSFIHPNFLSNIMSNNFTIPAIIY